MKCIHSYCRSARFVRSFRSFVREVGAVVELRPQHCDPTVNLHDFFVCHRGGVVEEVIAIAGRGPGL